MAFQVVKPGEVDLAVLDADCRYTFSWAWRNKTYTVKDTDGVSDLVIPVDTCIEKVGNLIYQVTKKRGD